MNKFCTEPYEYSLPISSLGHSVGIRANSRDYECGFVDENVDPNIQSGGETSEKKVKNSIFLRSTTNYPNITPNVFGSCSFSIVNNRLRGHRIMLQAEVSSTNILRWGGLWMRIDSSFDGNPTDTLAIDNMSNRPLKGTVRSRICRINMFVKKRASVIHMGLVLDGTGEIRCKNLRLTTSVAPRSRGLLFRQIPMSCILDICSFLDDADDFFSLSRVCKFSHNILIKSNINQFNRRSFYHIHFTLKRNMGSPNVLRNLIRKKQQPHQVITYVEYLRVRIDLDYFDENATEIITKNFKTLKKKIRKIFPNIHTLQIIGGYTGVFRLDSSTSLRVKNDPVCSMIRKLRTSVSSSSLFPIRVIDMEQTWFLESIRSITGWSDFDNNSERRNEGKKLNDALKKRLYEGHHHSEFSILPLKTLLRFLKSENDVCIERNLEFACVRSERLICEIIYRLLVNIRSDEDSLEIFRRFVLRSNFSTWSCAGYAMLLEWRFICRGKKNNDDSTSIAPLIEEAEEFHFVASKLMKKKKKKKKKKSQNNNSMMLKFVKKRLLLKDEDMEDVDCSSYNYVGRKKTKKSSGGGDTSIGRFRDYFADFMARVKMDDVLERKLRKDAADAYSGT